MLLSEEMKLLDELTLCDVFFYVANMRRHYYLHRNACHRRMLIEFFFYFRLLLIQKRIEPQIELKNNFTPQFILFILSFSPSYTSIFVLMQIYAPCRCGVDSMRLVNRMI